MHRGHTVAAVGVGALLALAGCGPADTTGTSAPTTSAPSATAPSRTVPPGTATRPGRTGPSTARPATGAPPARLLGATQRRHLALVVQQERAGLDAYSVFAARYRSQRAFANLAASQRTQLATVRAMLARYGLRDPSAGRPAGRYADPAVQRLYDSTVAAGTSVGHALDAAEHFEQHNLASLRTARAAGGGTGLATMYANLERASDAHLSTCDDARLPAGRPPMDRTRAHQPDGVPPGTGRPGPSRAPAGQPRTGQPPTGQPRTGQPPAGQPRVGQPRMGQRPGSQPRTGSPPMGVAHPGAGHHPGRHG